MKTLKASFKKKSMDRVSCITYTLIYIANLPQHDLKELRRLYLVNHKYNVRDTSCEMILDILFTHDTENYLNIAKSQDAVFS